MKSTSTNHHTVLRPKSNEKIPATMQISSQNGGS